MEKVNIDELKKQLLNRIDIDDLKEVEKVERYCDLLEIIKQCRQKIKDEGPSVTIENGKQKFTKSHPSMNDLTKLNAQLISLEKTFNFVNDVLVPPSTASTVEGEPEFTKDDLV